MIAYIRDSAFLYAMLLHQVITNILPKLSLTVSAIALHKGYEPEQGGNREDSLLYSMDE